MRSLRRRVGGKEQEAKEGGGQGAGGQGGWGARSRRPRRVGGKEQEAKEAKVRSLCRRTGG